MTSGLAYPYTKYDRLLGTQIDLDLEFNPATTPPSGTAGGAGRYKYWVDTTSSSLRQCIAARATAGVYVPAEWITLGVIDIAGAKFHFNTDQVDFTGGSGSLIVTNLTVTGATTLNTLTVTGATSLNTLTVSGATTLNTLTVTGASELHATGITGDLAVTGNTTIGGSLGVTGAITGGAVNGTSLNISGSSSLHDTTVTGNLNTTGSITGGSISTAGTLYVGGVATIGSIPYLHVTGDADIDGALNADGAITSGTTITAAGAMSAASLGTAGLIDAGTTIHAGGQISGDSLDVSTTIDAGGAINGSQLNVTGAIGGASLTVTGGIGGASLTVTSGIGAASATISGAIVSGTYVEAEQYRITESGTSYMFATIGTDVGALATLILGPEFAVSGQGRIGLYNTGQTYNKADEHNFWGLAAPFATFCVFNSAGTANVSGSWNVISDDSVKENVTPYTPGLAELLQLDVVSFNYMVPDAAGTHWSPFADPVGTTTPKVHYGLMASNVQAVIPEMVTEMSFSDIAQGLPSTPLATIAPTHLVWVLTNAVKTLAAKDDEHDQRIDTLEGADLVFAPLDSPAFTGLPTAPTAEHNVSNEQLATTAFVRRGTVSADNAPTGQVGEYLQAQALSTAAIPLTTLIDTGVTTLALTAGDWDVWASVGWTMGNPNNVTLKAWINAGGGAVAPPVDQVGGNMVLPIANGTPQAITPVTPMRISLASTTVVRLGVTATIGGGTVSAWGKIMARRVR